ncbi:DUF3157 family protein [Photobacterium lutimaris]|uniref:DUF3157 domain-containing protein n=1 Tax=Photobacterium lutimaris TaxID=388278 RepID=A0A2T3IL43_9GAMM|nr:DUF3157 family protein [Photobacterium lutimaris]PSU29074.1 hypothetical protein C9I99_25450 [Photobacterium lutimaris]TDR75683.1 uncharacterized protein DUF3157 [Photobacterium lutimaris]
MRLARQVFIKVVIASLLFGFIQFVQASSMIVTLPDGREVMLLDDHTWQFVEDAKQADIQSNRAAKSVTTETTTGKAVTAGTAAAVGASAVASTSSAVSSPASGDLVAPNTGRVVGEYQRSGVVIVAQPASYQDGRLTIPVSLRNEGTDSVILIEVATILRNNKGEVIKRDNHVVWTSIKRMPETYFRPGTEKEGKILTFSVPKLEHYFLDANITTVERW